MPDETPRARSARPPLASAPAATQKLDPVAVLAACDDGVRYEILRTLFDGSALSVVEVAKRLHRSPDSIAKQFRVLRRAGVVALVPSPDGDGRKVCLRIPDAFRVRDAAGRAALDFGAVLLRLD